MGFAGVHKSQALGGLGDKFVLWRFVFASPQYGKLCHPSEV